MSCTAGRRHRAGLSNRPPLGPGLSTADLANMAVAAVGIVSGIVLVAMLVKTWKEASAPEGGVLAYVDEPQPQEYWDELSEFTSSLPPAPQGFVYEVWDLRREIPIGHVLHQEVVP